MILVVSAFAGSTDLLNRFMDKKHNWKYGLIVGVLGFDDAGTALMLAIFALQDSFGTACNVTGDGAIALIINKIKTDKMPAENGAGER